jgi:hypothetical protein
VTGGLVRFCGDCGAELPLPGLPGCYDHMDKDTVIAVAKTYNRLALQVMRGWDRAQAVAQADVKATQAAAALGDVQAGLPALQAAVTEAVAAERAAQDAERKAAEHARKCGAAEKRASREQGSPERQTEALMRARSAADVAGRAKAALEGATAARAAAEAAVAGHHGKIAAAEEAAEAAERAAEYMPETVEMSEWTGFTCHPLLVLNEPDLSPRETAAVTLQVKFAAMRCGLEDALRAEGRQEGRDAAEGEARQRPVLVSTDGGPNVRLVPQAGTWRGRKG